MLSFQGKTPRWAFFIILYRFLVGGISQFLEFLQSKHGLEDRDQVLRFIRKFPDGIDVDEVKDEYPTVMEDVQVNSIDIFSFYI